MRRILIPFAMLAAVSPALAGTAYTPLPLQPANVVSPSVQLAGAAQALLQAARDGDVDAVGTFLAPRIQAVDGALELHIPRRVEVLGPFDTPTALLSEMANYIGGDVEMPPDGQDPVPLRLRAELDYIRYAIEDLEHWGTDPMMPGATCTYAYRSFDIAGLAALSDQTGVAPSSFVYVDKPYGLHAENSADAPVIGTLETDRLYALDYDTPAPGEWIAVYLPDGRSGFASFDAADFQKPYAAGICFAQDSKGRWLVVGQASTSL